MASDTALTALALNCTLKPSPASSSTQKLTDEVLAALATHGVTGESVRVVDLNIRPGVDADMGEGDAWPALRERVLAADILVLATPTWMGHASSVAQRVLERLDAELSETDEEGRPTLYGKVAIVANVGNEDGAHQIFAQLAQALNDVGFTLPAQANTYWNGESMAKTDYQDLPDTPEATASATSATAANAAHLARMLAGSNYP
ncbi:MAG: flavodoxin [Schumannella sp.]|nr:flavodoxin [Schumannella sp.]